MASVIDICNIALAHLGDEAEVASIVPPDGSIQSKHCGRFYPIARDRLLEMHPWSFAIKRATLASVTAPDGWSYAYAMPAKVIRSLAVLPAGALDDSQSDEFVQEADDTGAVRIYTNTLNATLRHIAQVEDTTKFTPGFVNTLGRLMAHYLAGPIIKGSEGMKVAQAQFQAFQVEFAKATAADANARHRNSYRDFTPAQVRARGLWSPADGG